MAIQATEKYCPVCGKDVPEPGFKRFGEWACSEAHAEKYVKEVRGQKLRAVTSEPARAEPPQRHGCCG